MTDQTVSTPPLARVTEPIKPGCVVAIVGFGFGMHDADDASLAIEQIETLITDLRRTAGHDRFTVVITENPGDVRVFPATITLDEIEQRLRS